MCGKVCRLIDKRSCSTLADEIVKHTVILLVHALMEDVHNIEVPPQLGREVKEELLDKAEALQRDATGFLGTTGIVIRMINDVLLEHIHKRTTGVNHYGLVDALCGIHIGLDLIEGLANRGILTVCRIHTAQAFINVQKKDIRSRECQSGLAGAWKAADDHNHIFVAEVHCARFYNCHCYISF